MLGTIKVSPVDPKIKSRIRFKFIVRSFSFIIPNFFIYFCSRLSAQQIKDYNWISAHVVSSENSVTSNNSNGSTTTASTNSSNPSTSKINTQKNSTINYETDSNDNIDAKLTTHER